MVNFQMFFLAGKLYKSSLYIARYFGHGQCFICEFSVLAFKETARLNSASFRNFCWSGNDTVLVCKLCMSSLEIKTLILDNIFIDRFLLVAFVKYILFRTVLFDTFCRLWKLLFFEENILKVLLYLSFFFIQKPITSISQK